jgi:hypothetical protein
LFSFSPAFTDLNQVYDGFSKSFPALDDIEQYCDNGNHKQNMDKPSHGVTTYNSQHP